MRSWIGCLSAKAAMSVETLRHMTFRAYEGVLFERLYSTSGVTPFLLKLKMRGRSSTSAGGRRCPLCLMDDDRPYFRKKWRLSFSTACLRHQCFLLDRCPACQAPLTIYRRLSEKGFPTCDKCGKLLRDADVEFIDQGSYGLKAIERMYDILDAGYVVLGDTPLYSFLFFCVIHQLSKVVYFFDRAKGFLDHEIMLDRMEDIPWQPKALVLEVVRLKEQYLLFSGLMSLFDDYPDNMLDYGLRNKLGKTELTKDLHAVPFWYSKIVELFDRSFWPVWSGEVSSAL